MSKELGRPDCGCYKEGFDRDALKVLSNAKGSHGPPIEIFTVGIPGGPCKSCLLLGLIESKKGRIGGEILKLGIPNRKR